MHRCLRISNSSIYRKGKIMFCQKCGTQLSDEDRFCPNCGTALALSPRQGDGVQNQTASPPPPPQDTLPSCSVPTAVLNQTESSARGQEKDGIYTLTKKKWFGSLIFKEVSTELAMRDDHLEITRTNTWFAFFKRPPVTYNVKYTSLKNIYTKASVDIIDGIFCGILAIFFLVALAIGVFAWWWLVLSILCAWTGYGKTLHILTSDVNYHIPSEDDEQAQQLIDALKHRLG